MDVKNLVAVVTGGGSGMGEATARVFAAAGMKVALWDLNGERAQQVASEIGGMAFKVNVADGPGVEEAFEQVVEKLGSPRVLVNCAGILMGERIAGREGPHSLENWRKMIDVNLTGSFNTMRVLASAMTKLEPLNEDGERGVIINTASISAYEGQIGQAAYSAAKGGIVGLTLPAARELAQFGVRVMAIAPGVVGTPMILSLPDKLKDALAQTTEFPKRMARPEEFGRLALHILENAMLNGEVIRIDGATRFQAK